MFHNLLNTVWILSVECCCASKLNMQHAIAQYRGFLSAVLPVCTQAGPQLWKNSSRYAENSGRGFHLTVMQFYSEGFDALSTDLPSVFPSGAR